MPSMKLKTLEHHLSQVEVFDKPKINLEQYTTTPHLSSIILHTIQSRYGDIENKLIGDLGCGCGILSIGATLLGATSCIGFEIDPDAIEICKTNFEDFEITNCDVINCDVTTGITEKWDGLFDTIIMNPPFGTRNKGVDVEFLQVALRIGKVVYSLHKTSTRDYFIKKSKMWNVKCNVLAELKFDVPQTYKFHNKKSVDIMVDVMQFMRND